MAASPAWTRAAIARALNVADIADLPSLKSSIAIRAAQLAGTVEAMDARRRQWDEAEATARLATRLALNRALKMLALPAFPNEIGPPFSSAGSMRGVGPPGAEVCGVATAASAADAPDLSVLVGTPAGQVRISTAEVNHA